MIAKAFLASFATTLQYADSGEEYIFMTRHGAMPLGGDNPPSSTFHDQGKFGRLFPTLPAFAADHPALRAALKEVGKKNGIMDAQDDVDDPVGLITTVNLR